MNVFKTRNAHTTTNAKENKCRDGARPVSTREIFCRPNDAEEDDLIIYHIYPKTPSFRFKQMIISESQYLQLCIYQKHRFHNSNLEAFFL